jgi:glycosyltransferase involved in cell wall biosynthesis
VYAQYLERRFGVKFKCPVQLPIIPLGIDMAHMEARVTPDKRAAQRAALGIADNEVMLLWVGRLSAAIKAHPLAMFQAAERAAQQSNAPLHFVLVGYFVPDEAEAQFQKLAQDFCSKVKIHFVKNNDAHFPDGLWAGADVFISLVDNMQESFGLTPIEAMAAGLPRIITDWDGYRDCVEHGVDGFLVPTLQPPPGSGDDLSRLLLNEREMYGGFLAKTALSVAVDVKAAADALVALINTPSLRKSIGDRARDRVRATYDWKHIIPQYESLWGELAARRKVRIPYPVVLPQAPDPFTVFESFASRILQKSGAVSVVASPDEIQKLWSHDVNMFAQDTMLSRETIVHILKHIAGQGTCSLGSVLEAFANVDAARIWRTMGWLIKLDILKHQK